MPKTLGMYLKGGKKPKIDSVFIVTENNNGVLHLIIYIYFTFELCQKVIGFITMCFYLYFFPDFLC